jgi:hypothetical protein
VIDKGDSLNFMPGRSIAHSWNADNWLEYSKLASLHLSHTIKIRGKAG